MKIAGEGAVDKIERSVSQATAVMDRDTEGSRKDNTVVGARVEETLWGATTEVRSVLKLHLP